MSGYRMIIINAAIFMIIILVHSIKIGYAQTAIQDTSSSRSAQAKVEAIQGEEREVTLTEAITAEPARPLIQFTHNRPRVTFTEVRIGPASRSFYPELRKGSEMEVGAPTIDILVLFPGILP